MERVALITGGSRGIGKAIAEKFAKNNYCVVINYVSEKTPVEELSEELKKMGAKDVLYIKTDVTNSEDCKIMIEQTIKKLGRIDVVVNNAGITKDGLLMRMKEEDFDAVIDTNLKGTFNVTKQATTYLMKQRYGKIINISSVVGICGNAGQSNYAASKAGIIGFTKSIAKELASRNILVNCVAPGFIETDMTQILPESVKENIYEQIPLKKMGTAKEVAEAVYFLASEQNTYITGQVLQVDGGMVM